MKFILFGLAFAVSALPAFAAVPAASADGSFTRHTMTMPVSTAMAFRGKSVLDKTDVIVVAVTNGDLRVDWFANFHDRRRAVQRRLIAIAVPPNPALSHLFQRHAPRPQTA